MATPKEMAQDQAAAKLAAKGQEAVTAELEKQKKLREQIKEFAESEAKILEFKKNAATATLLQEEKINAAMKERVKLNEELAMMNQLKDEDGNTEQDKADANAEIKLLQEKLDLQKKTIQASNEELSSISKRTQLISEQEKVEKKFGKEGDQRIEKANKRINTVEDAIAKFAGKLPVIGGALRKAFDMKDNLASFGKSLTSAGKAMGPDSTLGKGLVSVGGMIIEFAASIGGVLLGVIALGIATAALAVKYDGLSKSFGRATGFSEKYNHSLQKGHQLAMMSGVTAEELTGSLIDVGMAFSGVNPEAQETNEYLAITASRLEKLGVSSSTSVKLMDHFHRAMGLSQKAAADMTAQLVMLGRQVGITASKLASDFAASAGVLARYGKDQIKVFKQLAVQAKATGLEMGTLLGMAEKFDNFDTAADSAANLNAVLGTQLSTLELMNANEADRIKMIKEQVQASVGNFDSLDKFTKMHIAQAMGLKDVDEAQRLLNMSQAETAANAAKMQEQADIQAELAKATAELVPLMTKLKIVAMKMFMVFSPLINYFGFIFGLLEDAYNLAAGITESMGDMGAAAEVLKTVFIAVGAIGLAIAGVLSAPVAAVIAIAAAIGTVAAEFDGTYASITGWSKMILGPIGAIMLFYDALVALYGILHKPGSPSMASGLFDSIGASIARFGDMILSPVRAVGMFADALGSLWDSTHSDGPSVAVTPKVETSGLGFDIQAMASLDTSKIAEGFNKIKSAVMELSNIKMDGFLAMHTDGSSSSFVMGSDGLIKSISEGKLIVDVKMPEMKLPEVLVKVFIGDRELKSIIRTEVKALGGAMG